MKEQHTNRSCNPALRALHHALCILCCIVLMVACTTDDGTDGLFTDGQDVGNMVEPVFTITEQPWESAAVGTRAGETMSFLHHHGFGLYCPSFYLMNNPVIWSPENVIWFYTPQWYEDALDPSQSRWLFVTNHKWILPRNFNISVSFNGADEQSQEDYYSFTGNHNFDDKFLGCTFDNIKFTQGLKMESSTVISFETTGVNTITIVQSDWSDNTLLFDDVTLPLASSSPIIGGRVYTLHGIAAGTHTIKRGSGESGVFYVSVNNALFAYAPYESTPTINTSTRQYTFTPAKENTDTLMWASVSHEGYGISLDFRHSLGNITFGTFTNKFGTTVTLTSITIQDKPAQRLYESGDLSLDDGTWSNLTAHDSEQLYTRNDFDPSTDGNQSLAVTDGTTVPLNIKGILQIPGPTVVITFNFTSAYGNETVSTELTLEQGKDKIISLTLNDNHLVVIE